MHDVNQDRVLPDLQQRFWAVLGLSPKARAFAAAENDNRDVLFDLGDGDSFMGRFPEDSGGFQ